MSKLRSIGITALAAVALAASQGPSAGAAIHRTRSITLEWVGDIAMSSQLGLPPGGVYNALAPVRPLLRKADITLGNLEGTLSVGGVSKCATLRSSQCFAFQAPPSTAFGLRALGFKLVNQANNHSMDYGVSGRQQTVAALNRAGIAHTGFPGEVTYLTVKHVRVAFLGFAPYPFDANLLDIPAAQALVRNARRHASIVIVIIHAGAEGVGALNTPHGTQYYLGENRGNARAFSHAVIKAGATIVLGSGPHVIRGIQRDDGHVIAYSLGNFVGYDTLSGGGVLNESAILRVTLGAGGHLLAARWLPIVLVDGLPRPDHTRASVALVERLSREDFPFDHFDIEGDGVFRLPAGRRR
jgi:poly-gamma-glutamate capsule biosynthesis protein CapA/YwtB (metallophosphatase superfamily)